MINKINEIICPKCNSEETVSVNDFLDQGLEYRECEDCGCKYKVHFTTIAYKIEIQ